ncbi:hypothetical protein Y032_0758g2109 [Ancylostoma ceylanicum]|uniref:Uncharacterized protein n=1 Tax=Ancylostoma ceylanicum TaxID=53326 RepID=A0A016WE58_9BILA|nr:hypothetical protein Y032_0758g2109 [Ancylostoma ceylanicum]
MVIKVFRLSEVRRVQYYAMSVQNLESVSYKTSVICVCSYAMCNLDLLLGRHPESIEHLNVLPRPAWNPIDSIDDCKAD